MSKREKSRIVFYIMIITVLLFCLLQATDDPRARMDYWQNNYDELHPDDDPRAARAHEIFVRVLNAAGRRPGVVPRLFIVKNETAHIPLAFAIPDGGIILSKKVLDICYADKERGDDRLAFLLAHEIAHQLKDDFWHMRFFEAVELSKEGGEKTVLDSVKVIVKMTDHVLAKEIQADEYGIIYASMAGFNTSAIVSEDVNFFEYFYASLDPENIKGFTKDESHPDAEQRAEVVKARLKQVLEVVEIFDIAVLFYQAEMYSEAITLFNDFLRFYPSREVYLNLATCHYQRSLEHYLVWKKKEGNIVFERFKFSLSIDSETRAKNIIVKRSGKPSELFAENMEKAIEYYRTAISQDPSYIYAYNNLGCALLASGDVYEAIAMFKKALKIDSSHTSALNNLGIAFFLAENEDMAIESLSKAREKDSLDDTPLFNLGRIAFERDDKTTAEKYWMEYLRIDPVSEWAAYIREVLELESEVLAKTTAGKVKENVLGVKVGDYDDELPSDWGELTRESEISVEEEPYKILQYKSGITILSQNNRILLITVSQSFDERSVGGISIGDREEDVFNTYGKPTQILNTSKGKSLVYSTYEISFQLRDGSVVSWLLF